MKNHACFRYVTTLRLDQTDASGRVFFGQILKICHDAYDEFLAANNFPISSILTAGKFSLAIVHAETDISRPLKTSDRLEILLAVERIGETSFTLNYEIRDPQGRPAAMAKTVHVAVSKVSQKKTKLPPALRRILNK